MSVNIDDCNDECDKPNLEDEITNIVCTQPNRAADCLEVEFYNIIPRRR